MCSRALPHLAILCFVGLVSLQAAGPQFRPALVGSGPKALVNVINTKKLMEKGQRDGILMFTCHVTGYGKVGNHIIYRDTPETLPLREEVAHALDACRFIPAVYNGDQTDVLFLGTVMFFVNDGKPHLRVYANQSHDDIKQGNNFVAPQLIPRTADWVGGTFELKGTWRLLQSGGGGGVTNLSMSVDANGNLKDMKVVVEDPPGVGFGDAARKLFARAKYVPGFRNGRPVDCTFEYPLYVVAWRYFMRQR